MRASFYERTGPGGEVLILGELPTPEPGPGEARVRLAWSGVNPARVGERVWVWNAAWGRAQGTVAEYVALPAEQAVPLPDGTDLAVGACLGIPALTAYHAVTVDGGVEGRSVLVAGGAGAVGHYAVQLAKLKGARQVIATVSSQAKAELAPTVGACPTRSSPTSAHASAASGNASTTALRPAPATPACSRTTIYARN